MRNPPQTRDRRLLVTGASGFLGWNICTAARGTWRVFGVIHSHAVDIPGATVARCDLTDFSALRRLFSDVKPDAVIHAAAASNPNDCQLRPGETGKINVDAAVAIAGLCANAGIPCVFTSSDLVFDGTRPPYRESDPVSPISIYGEQKMAAEKGMADRNPGSVICRIPLMFGDPGPVASSFIQPLIKGLRDQKQLTLFTDEYRTPVSGARAARGLLLAITGKERLLHLGGRQRISRYDFGLLLAKIYSADASLIRPCMRKDISMPAPRPPDVSLDSGRAFNLGYDPGTIEQELASLRSAALPI